MLAGLQQVEPDYDLAYRRLIWGGGPGAGAWRLSSAVRGMRPTAGMFPEAAVWLQSAAAQVGGILPWGLRGVAEVSELKVREDSGGAFLGTHDISLEFALLLCRSPAACLVVHAAWFGLFVLADFVTAPY